MTRPRSTLRRAVAAAVGVAWLVAAIPASAHAVLEATFPVAGATLSAPPAEVAASFSEAVGTNSTIELLGPDGGSLATGGVDPDDPARLVLTAPDDLGPGTYEVRWQVFSEDADLVRGTFEFTVTASPLPSTTGEPTATAVATASGSATATPEPTDAPVPTPSAAPASDPAGGAAAAVPIAAAVGVLLVLGGVLLRRRSVR